MAKIEESESVNAAIQAAVGALRGQLMSELAAMISIQTSNNQNGFIPDRTQQRITQSHCIFTPSYPWGSNYTWGLAQDTVAGTITVYQGKVRRLGTYTYTVPSQAVTFSAGTGKMIIWQWSIANGLKIQNSPKTIIPADDGSTFYGMVAKFDVTVDDTSGLFSFTMTDYCGGGVIIMPVFAPAGA